MYKKKSKSKTTEADVANDLVESTEANEPVVTPETDESIEFSDSSNDLQMQKAS